MRLADGGLKCWGNNLVGALGLGDKNDRGDQPGEMGDALPKLDLGQDVLVARVDMGYHFGCALLVGGALKCWGINDRGTLGLGDEQARGDGPGDMGDALPTVKLLGP